MIARVVTDEERLRELVHKVNNLIGIVYTQTAVARASDEREPALRALELIETAAQETAEIVQRCRRRD